MAAACQGSTQYMILVALSFTCRVIAVILPPVSFLRIKDLMLSSLVSSSAPGRLENAGRFAGQSSTPQTFRQTSESTKEVKSHVSLSQQASDVSRRTLQVESKGHHAGRSPSASPDRGTTPTSPYSVPQIAPLPSSTLCPICNTTDLTSSPNQPNFNKCTQCRNEVCNQCGFNPNPHLTEVTLHIVYYVYSDKLSSATGLLIAHWTGSAVQQALQIFSYPVLILGYIMSNTPVTSRAAVATLLL